MILTGGTDGERVKGWSVPEMRFICSIMRDKEGFVIGAEVLDITTAQNLVQKQALAHLFLDCSGARRLDRMLG